jgi:hypothetical protein
MARTHAHIYFLTFLIWKHDHSQLSHGVLHVTRSVGAFCVSGSRLKRDEYERGKQWSKQRAELEQYVMCAHVIVLSLA